MDTKQGYTQFLSDEIWIKSSEDYDINKTIEFLNSEDFRSFGESLSEIIKRKMPPTRKSVTPAAYLKECALKKSIDIASVNTYTNWFRNKLRPKKSAESRETMFRIAFSLDLNKDETAELFHKAYLDRAFDCRNYRELIYYYCIYHGHSFQHAQKMISEVSFETEIQDNTIRTIFLEKGLLEANSDEDLIQFINEHPHNFNLGKSNYTAREYFESLKAEALCFAQQEVESSQLSDEYRNRSKTSINFLYSVITNMPTSGNRGTLVSFKNALLPKEIKQNFPQPSIFANDNPSYEELRKIIILLYSYTAYYRVQHEEESYEYDDYIADLNNILYETNMSELYAGNPFDWLFMMCAAESIVPLDTFRDVLSKALYPDI